MQPHRTGEFLRARGATWRLRQHIPYESCTQLELDPALPSRLPESRTLLEPFDRPERLPVSAGTRTLTRRSWMRALLAAAAGECRIDRLLAPADAAIDILPYQLEPALAMALGGVPRLLLADAVGLGKTIQAALVLAELRAHGQLRRALILTPPGLRDQWCDELRQRFRFAPVVADTAWLRAASLDLPAGTSPWSMPQVLVASIDFVKRPDVRTGLDRLTWDLVIVDEAHTASADTERRGAVDAIGRQARRLLLVTATPHAGDGRAFDALCGIGATRGEGPIPMIRRTRPDVGYALARRVHALPVRLTPAELDLHRQLLAYTGRIWRERARDAHGEARLAAIVLLKRACSSVTALAESLAFRLEHLGAPAAALVAQLGLPFDGESDDGDTCPLVVLAAPGFDDAHAERDTLLALVAAARAAEADDSKLRVLARWLRRVPEACLVFTEYRDTLLAIQRGLVGAVPMAVLHGELDRAARREALACFTSGRARVLLATDVAGEGLNLQTQCRTVVHIELPWTPIRLEQRIGRVDRIGQRRTVHSLNLVASDTFERTLLSRLVVRTSCIRQSLGAFDDVVGAGDDSTVAEALLGEADLLASQPPRLRPSGATGGGATALVPTDGDELRGQLSYACERRRVGEALRIREASAARHGARRTFARSDRTLVAAVSRRRIEHVPTGLFVVHRLIFSDADGAAVDDCLVPVFVRAHVPVLRGRRDVTAAARRVLGEFGDALDQCLARIADERLAFIRWRTREREAPGRLRIEELLHAWGPPPAPIQRSLFDSREERDADACQRASQETSRTLQRELRRGGGVARLDAPGRILVLMVTP